MSQQAQPNPPTVFEAALDYARCGIPIFPCNPIDKQPLTPHGFKDATRDETQILAWWQQYPNAMVSAPMGPASGLWAIDLDVDPTKKIDGKATLDQLDATLAPPWLIALAKATKAKAWAKAALERECKAVAAAQPGTRNTTLNTAAFNLFQIVAGRGLDEQEVRDRLFEAAVTCGLVADDGATAVEATIESGAQAGRKQPRTRPQPLSHGSVRPTIQIIDGQLLRILGETEDALLASGLPVFSRAGMLVEPVSESMPASDGCKAVVARLRPLSPESFLGPAAESAAFQKYDRKRNRWVDTDPPLRHMRVILASERRWRFPHVTGVISIPTLRPDGSLLVDPGHDSETELYLLP